MSSFMFYQESRPPARVSVDRDIGRAHLPRVKSFPDRAPAAAICYPRTAVTPETRTRLFFTYAA